MSILHENWGNQRLFDLVAEEAKLLYFFDKIGGEAVRPAIIITSGPVGFRRVAGSKDQWTLWVGDGVKWFSFPTYAEAEAKADEISKGVRKGVVVRKVRK
jgi:hypothetical protein